jgi:Calcipressin
MVRYSASLPSSRLSLSPPRSQKTNTITVTGLPKSFFHPIVLDVLRSHFAAYGEINRWVPLQGFGRIIIVFLFEDSAESAKQHCDPIVFQGPLDM